MLGLLLAACAYPYPKMTNEELQWHQRNLEAIATGDVDGDGKISIEHNAYAFSEFAKSAKALVESNKADTNNPISKCTNPLIKEFTLIWWVMDMYDTMDGITDQSIDIAKAKEHTGDFNSLKAINLSLTLLSNGKHPYQKFSRIFSKQLEDLDSYIQKNDFK